MNLALILSQGSINRLERIQELKGYDQNQAIDFAISIAWFTLEKQTDIVVETTKGENMSETVEVLKKNVVQILVTEYDFLLETAENEVEESTQTDQGMWNVNAEAKDIAKYLASDDQND